ncbi:MAG: 50S ribosomal protein L25 [Aquificaceae bacterium]|nr:50S ribosomal protein L25 [Aquificaceae bacterium]
MRQIELTLLPRELSTKGELKKKRAEGFIPVEIYGKDCENLHAFASVKDLRKLPIGETMLIKAIIDRQTRLCILKSVQTGWLGDNILHIDLQDISHLKQIDVEVPIEFSGTPAGVGLGGTFEALMKNLTIRADISLIPEKIVIDVSRMGLGDALHVRDISPPEGCKIMNSPEDTIAVVLEPESEQAQEGE